MVYWITYDTEPAETAGPDVDSSDTDTVETASPDYETTLLDTVQGIRSDLEAYGLLAGCLFAVLGVWLGVHISRDLFGGWWRL